MTEWYCTFHYPPNWIEIVHRQGDVAPATLVQEAIDTSFTTVAPGERQQVADHITGWMDQDARLDAAVSAHGYDQPRPGANRHMHMTMWVTERSLPASVEDELRLLSDTVWEAGADVEPPEVTEVHLPAGRALRVRQRDHAGTPDGTDATVHTLDYWVPIDATKDLLWLHFWTADIDGADSAAALFDQMAAAVTLESTS